MIPHLADDITPYPNYVDFFYFLFFLPNTAVCRTVLTARSIIGGTPM